MTGVDRGTGPITKLTMTLSTSDVDTEKGWVLEYGCSLGVDATHGAIGAECFNVDGLMSKSDINRGSAGGTVAL
ncbi:UNVERIFIED_CONTAM: hypothetical protein K2H54_056371 [Gekko kuhli]